MLQKYVPASHARERAGRPRVVRVGRARARRRLFPRLHTLLAGLVVLCGLCLFTPLGDLVQQIILLGPDSLFPPSPIRTVTVIRHGHRVEVAVVPGIVREHLTFRSVALNGGAEDYSIYLPPGYNSSANRARRYPVLYLLHGAPGQPADWFHGMHVQLMEDPGVAAGTLPPMIIVAPEGNGGVFHDSQYVNTHDGFRAEDLIAHDVVHYIDSHYRTIRDRQARAIAGISEGGYGALNLGLKHLDTFGILASISGYVSADPAEVLLANDPWGHDAPLMVANSPLRYLPRLARRSTLLRATRILIMASTGDGGYTAAAERFGHILAVWHVPHTVLLQPSPNPLFPHYWPYWKMAFPEALAYIGHHLRTATVAPARLFDVPLTSR